jgi:type I site-specific restriction-modification system R (restriction) subunit
MYERENILKIFKEVKNSLEKGDSAKIKSLSDHTTNSAALTLDPDNIAAAVVVYSLSKILERDSYKKLAGWNSFYKTYVKNIDRIIKAIEEKDDLSYRKSIEEIINAVEMISGNLKENIKDVFRKASINKASKLYEHGISMEKTAKLLNVSLIELASYAGEKEIYDVPESKTVPIKERLKIAFSFFD